MQQQNLVADVLEAGRHSLGHVVHDADDADDWRGINSGAQRLVIERNIAAGNRRSERIARLGNAVDRIRKLCHDFWLLRIAEVEAVGCGDRRRTATGDLASCLGHRVHRTKLGVEIAPATVAGESHRDAAFGLLRL